MEKIIQEWNECNLMKLFEIPVINKRTGKKDWIIFDIFIWLDKEQGNHKFRAKHEALNRKEAESKYIPYKELEIDSCFSLDENLQELHSECEQAVIDSDFFELREEE